MGKNQKDTSKKSSKSHEQSDPAKNNIMGWCKADKIKCVDESSKNPHLMWLLTVADSVMIYKQPHLSDRIYIQSEINISPEHRTLIESKQDVKNNLMLNIPATATNLNVGYRLGIKDKKLMGVTLNRIHFASTISKADLLRNTFRVQQVHQTLLNQLRNTLGLELQQSQQQQIKPDASDVGIQ